MKGRDLLDLGVFQGEALKHAQAALKAGAKTGLGYQALKTRIAEIVAQPDRHVDDAVFGAFAQAMIAARAARARFEEREAPAPHEEWGSGFEPEAVQQLRNACRLPIAVRGALMPDAHVGYGLPIGGVLATHNAVIPYAVGVDIACRMKMTVLDLPVSAIDEQESRLVNALEKETLFGVGATWTPKLPHPVIDEDWSFSSVAKQFKDKAWGQLGTSGSGNHFVEFGVLTLDRADLGLDTGQYLALLSHSGSRGTGAQIANHFSKLAMDLHPELPRELSQLAWLDLDSDSGQEYWLAMELMGRYAAANHALIHQRVARHLGADVLLDIENHHNFAWKETHDGQEVIVHRKGATPAGAGVLGIVPGSMGTPGYVVRGKGNPESLNSASHGAGRKMSRRRAMELFTWEDARRFLDERRVKLLSAGLDEVPMAYKDIEEVMHAQADLVDRVARFDPRLVKMAPAGEQPED